MLDDLQTQLSKAAAEGKDVTPYQIKQWAKEAAIREVNYWKNFGSKLQQALEEATETAPPDIQKQIKEMEDGYNTRQRDTQIRKKTKRSSKSSDSN